MTDMRVLDLVEKKTSRRRFLRDGGIAALAAGVATACKADAAKAPPIAAATSGAAPSAADAMDAMHEKGIKAFPAKTSGMGNQLLAPTIDNGVKVYELT